MCASAGQNWRLPFFNKQHLHASQILASTNGTHNRQGNIGRGGTALVITYAPCSADVDRGQPALCTFHSLLRVCPTNIVHLTFGMAYTHCPWPTQICQQHLTCPACSD